MPRNGHDRRMVHQRPAGEPKYEQDNKKKHAVGDKPHAGAGADQAERQGGGIDPQIHVVDQPAEPRQQQHARQRRP